MRAPPLPTSCSVILCSAHAYHLLSPPSPSSSTSSFENAQGIKTKQIHLIIIITPIISYVRYPHACYHHHNPVIILPPANVLHTEIRCWRWNGTSGQCLHCLVAPITLLFCHPCPFASYHLARLFLLPWVTFKGSPCCFDSSFLS